MRSKGRPGRWAVVVASVPLVSMLALGPSPSAVASWSSSGQAEAAGAAYMMPSGGTPVAGASGGAVTVSWSAAQFPSGAQVAGYLVTRYDAGTGGVSTVTGGCSGIVTSTSCTDGPVPTGRWVYTETPVQLSWSGVPSPLSAPVTMP